MNGYADPRRASYFNESAFAAGGYAGLRNGIQIPDDERINNFSRYNVTASTSLMWMNARRWPSARRGRFARLGDGRRRAELLRGGYPALVRALRRRGSADGLYGFDGASGQL